MELHENLYQLGISFGRDVFDDADGLRAALDDFLDEGAASTGDINLLVDAVRLGSFQWMVHTIESGAEPSRAIESAGDLLARDRGSADVAGSRWACAVLGFAVGKVTDTDVRRYRTQGPPLPPQAQPAPTSPAPPPMSPTMVPPPVTPQSPSTPGTQLAGQPAPAFSAPPPAGPAYPQSPPPVWSSQPTPPTPPATKKKGLLPLLIGVGIGVLILAVVFGVLQLTGDDDKDPGAEPDDPKSGETTEVTEEPLDLDFTAINERYSALGTRVTTGQSECLEGEPLSGQTESLDCTFPQGTLNLTTYDTLEELEAARLREVNTEVGGRYAEGASGVVFSFAPEGATPTLYWDNESALQSGLYEASSATVEVGALASVFQSVGAQVQYPEGLTDPDLTDFADLWVRVNQCERIQTLARGELEESLCKARRQIQVYVGKFENKAAMIAYRQTRLRDSRQDGLILNPPDWTYGDGPVEGRLADSYAEGDRVLRYWDLNDCLCYMEAYYPTNDLTALTNWWVDPRPQG